MKYRRAKVAGGTYFFTIVTHNRRPFLCEPENIALLRDAFKYVKDSRFHHHVRQGIYKADWGA